MRRFLIAAFLVGLALAGGVVASADALTIDPVTGFPIMVPDTETRVSRLESQVSGLVSQMAALLLRLEATDAKLATAESAVQTTGAKVASLESQLTQAKTRITTLESQVAVLASAPAPAPAPAPATSTGTTSGTTSGVTSEISGGTSTATAPSIGSTTTTGGETSTGTTGGTTGGSTGTTTATITATALRGALSATEMIASFASNATLTIKTVDAQNQKVEAALSGVTVISTPANVANVVSVACGGSACTATIRGTPTAGTATILASKGGLVSWSGTITTTAPPPPPVADTAYGVAVADPRPGSIAGNGSSIAQITAKVVDASGNEVVVPGRFLFEVKVGGIRGTSRAFLQGAASDSTLTVSTSDGKYTAIIQAQSVSPGGPYSTTVHATFTPDNPAQTLPGGASASATLTVTAP